MPFSPTLPRVTTTKLVGLAGVSLIALVAVSNLSASAENSRRSQDQSRSETSPPTTQKVSPHSETISSDFAERETLINLTAQIESESVDVVAAERNEPAQVDGKLRFENAQTSLIQNAFVAAPMSGVVNRVAAREGQMVYLDAPLVQLQNELAKKELIAAQAAYDAASLKSDNDVDLRYARRTLQVRENEMRQSVLANETYAGAVNNMELEKLRLNVDQATLAIEQAEHELMVAAAAAIEKEIAVSIAQTQLDRHTIRTTVAGMVTEVAVEPGEWVEAGEPLVRIISLDPIRVECFADGRKHGRELVGRDVQFVPAGAVGDEALQGSITFVSPELHPVTGQVRIWATVNNPDAKFGSGTPGRLELK